ncbi:MAG: signal peptide peptidase SppA [Elusimicrobia bacterium]|nr:signal peptide peptidase SppA [Elusimicrobiota bacterium]
MDNALPPETPPNTPSPAPPGPAPDRRLFQRLTVLSMVALFAGSLAVAVIGLRQKTEPAASMDASKLLLSRRPNLIGVVSLRGPIYDSDESRMFGAPRIEAWVRRFKRLIEKENVKAIVIEINSPGGSVGAVQEIFSQVKKMRSKTEKPIIAYVGDVAASGGYYVASACDKIVVHPGSLTGSIGVIFSVSNFTELMKKVGVQMTPIKSGKHKDIGSPTRNMTDEERKLLQELIDDAYGQFLSAVSEGRNMPLEQLRPLADGRIFTGAQARKLGLVDVLGDSEDALNLAAELAGIPESPQAIRDSDPWQGLIEILGTAFKGPSLGALAGFAPRPRLEYMWGGLGGAE